VLADIHITHNITVILLLFFLIPPVAKGSQGLLLLLLLLLETGGHDCYKFSFVYFYLNHYQQTMPKIQYRMHIMWCKWCSTVLITTLIKGDFKSIIHEKRAHNNYSSNYNCMYCLRVLRLYDLDENLLKINKCNVACIRTIIQCVAVFNILKQGQQE